MPGQPPAPSENQPVREFIRTLRESDTNGDREITKEEYDRWRYYYPEYDTSGQWHKITPSQELSDMLMEALNINGEEDNL